MKTVYDVWFTCEYEHREDTELHIGIYSQEIHALSVIDYLKEKTGFSDYPEGFEIIPTNLGITSWQEGFVPDIASPLKTAKGRGF